MTRVQFDDLSDNEIEHLHRAGLISDNDVLRVAQERMSPRDWAILDGIAYGVAKLFHTPINQLVADAADYRAAHGGPSRVGASIIGSKAGAWTNQALDYALNADSPYVATAYMKPAPEHIYDVRSRWVVYVMRTRQALDDWYGSLVGSPDRYHYLAVFDKTSPEWAQGRPVAVSTGDPDAYVGALPGRSRSGATPSSREQLQHLDRLVASHETHWAAYAQQHPTPQMHDFLRQHWDPFFTSWMTYRPYFDTAEGVASVRYHWIDLKAPADEDWLVDRQGSTSDIIASFLHEVAGKLSALRYLAAYNGIPTPDLGTAQHGVEDPRVSGIFDAISQGERHMSEHAGFNPYAGADYVGADGGYPGVAARAVAGVYQQSPSPIYGYLRAGIQQKIYLFHTLDQGSGWFATIVHGQAQPYDYAAVFAATDLSQPVPGLESFGHTAVSGDAYVGSVLPFLLGLPLGGLAGYFLRRWQEENPGHTLPLVPPGKLPAPVIPPAARSSGDYVGGPWLDVAGPYVGGPWLDVVSGGAADQEEPVTREDIDSLAQALSRTFGIPAEQISADLMEIARGMNVNVGGPWLDLVSPYDNPWLAAQASPSHARVADWLGAAYGVERHLEGARPVYSEAVRMRAWPQTRALIESAKREITDNNASYPAAAWVWALDPSGPSSVPGVQLTGGTSSATPFSSHDQALDYMRSRIQTPHVALALFDATSPHWPNPVNWTKSDDPAYELIIAQRLGQSQSPRMAGDYAGTAIGSAIEDVRERAQALAARRAGDVVGVIHTSKDGLWHTLAFRTSDDADDWLGTATHDPAAFTYAAYYDKSDFSWPRPVNEKIGGGREGARPGETIRRGIATTSGRWAA